MTSSLCATDLVRHLLNGEIASSALAINTIMLAAVALFAGHPTTGATSVMIAGLTATFVPPSGGYLLVLLGATGLVVYTSPLWLTIVHALLSSILTLAVWTSTDHLHDSGPLALGLVGAISGSIGWGFRAGIRKKHRLHHQIRTLEEQHSRAVQDERRRITDELHNIIAHELTRIALHTEVLSCASTSTQQNQSIKVIRDSSQQALKETRRVLRVAREPQDINYSAAPNIPSTDVLAVLLHGEAELHALGIKTVMDIPEKLELPASVNITLLHVTRECIANLAKHASRQQAVRIHLSQSSGAVTLDIINYMSDYGTPLTHSSGYGLPRIRERVTLLGGQLTAGAEGCTWRTTAVLPTR